MTENLNYYKVFYTVVQKGSFSAAANALFISQPAVSQTISRLEETLKTKLMKRSSHEIALTPEGKILASHLDKAFSEINLAREELQRVNDLQIGELKIGVSTSLCRHVLLPCLKEFIQNHPHIRLSINCHSTADTLIQLEKKEVDLGMICEASLPKDYLYIPVMEVHDIFIASPSYLKNLSVRESAAVPDISGILEKCSLMMLDRENFTRKHIDRYLDAHSIHPSQILEINNMDILLDFAAIGMGVSAVIREFSEAVLEKKEVVMLPLSEPIPSRTVGFACRKNLSPDSPAGYFLKECLDNPNFLSSSSDPLW